MSSIKENIQIVKENAQAAAIKSGRTLDDITILGVTKTVDTDTAKEVLANGLTDLGENRVQELCNKYEQIGDAANWHLIGHLQKNKVKYIVDKVKLIHSVDSIDLLKEISKQAGKHNVTANVLAQLNVSGEESKFGMTPKELPKFLEEASKIPNIMVKGLMTMAPFTQDEAYIRKIMEKTNKIFVDNQREKSDNIDIKCLSMGMSNDYQIAIEEGATIVRIGTALFK